MSTKWRMRNWHNARRLFPLLQQGTIKSLSSRLVILATSSSCHELCNATFQLLCSYFLSRLHYEAQVDNKTITSKYLKIQIKMYACAPHCLAGRQRIVPREEKTHNHWTSREKSIGIPQEKWRSVLPYRMCKT